MGTVGGLRPLCGGWNIFLQLCFREEWEKDYRMSRTPIPASLLLPKSKKPLASFFNAVGMDLAAKDIISLTLHPLELEMDGGPWIVRAKRCLTGGLSRTFSNVLPS